MRIFKKLGIWMDHSNAHLIEPSPETAPANLITTASVADQEEDGGYRGEKTLHHKEENELSVYYKSISEAILHYDQVILFGPTDAKIELYNLLKADHHFDKIKITTQQADKMTGPQQHAFVKDYFSNS